MAKFEEILLLKVMRYLKNVRVIRKIKRLSECSSEISGLKFSLLLWALENWKILELENKLF